MSSSASYSLTLDKFVRLVILGNSGGATVFAFFLAVDGEGTAAMICLGAGMLMWLVWFVLFYVETDVPSQLTRRISQ